MQAEPEFMLAAKKCFSVEKICSEELDELYQCADVDVLRLQHLPDGSAAGGCLTLPPILAFFQPDLSRSSPVRCSVYYSLRRWRGAGAW